MARIPTSGPNASSPQAIRQLPASLGSSKPTPRIVTPVRVKPAATWTESAEPLVPAGASSETAVENCAESATTVMPQTMATPTTSGTGAPNRNAETTADVPET